LNITDEMIDWFEKRTNRHIDLVWKYLYKYFNSSSLPDEIDEMVKEDHDASKFKEPELTPYILITWNYHCKDLGIPFNLTSEIKKMMNEATEHHVRSNRHHPEYWSERTDSLIPKDDGILKGMW